MKDYGKSRWRVMLLVPGLLLLFAAVSYLGGMEAEITLYGLLLALSAALVAMLWDLARFWRRHRALREADPVLGTLPVPGGAIEAEHYLQLPKDLPTAFFCNCDLTGGILIRKLESVGLRVPEDVSIVGFDNYIYPGICDIEITSYDVNATEMAQTAVDHLLAKIEERPYRKGQVMIEGSIVEKDSVRKLKK